MTFSTAGNSMPTILNGRALALFASVTMVNTVIDVNGVPAELPVVEAVIQPILPSSTATGSSAADVVMVPGDGFINVENNGGLVTASETGTGTIAIVNNGGVLTATNTGNGRVTVNATGTAAVTITHTGDEDFTYPN
jgi:hypothetical protein